MTEPSIVRKGRKRPALTMALGLLMLLTLFGAAHAQEAPAPEPGVAETESARGGPAPRPWRSYPLSQVDGNVADQAKRDACDFEDRQSTGGRKALLIFNLGRANRHRGEFGVRGSSEFRSNRRVTQILLGAARAYSRCRGGANKRVDIAYGVTNYKLSKAISSRSRVRAAGEAQRRVVMSLKRLFPPGVGAAGAGDFEPGWDHRGSDEAISLVQGGAGGAGDYYNIGSAGHCKPFGEGCQGDWTYADIGRVSQDARVRPLPQIFYPAQPATWQRIARRWDKRGRNCPRHRTRNCFDFGGVTAHPTGCANVQFSPSESWYRLDEATNRRIGRRLIYYNPRRVLCRTATTASASEPRLEEPLPLMSQPVPGEIVADPEPWVSEYELGELVNAWRAGSRRDLTMVYAGSPGIDPETGAASNDGRLIVTREIYMRHRPTERFSQTVDLAGTGAVRIVDAPVGLRAARSDGLGEIGFVSESGAAGTLDLATAQVSLRRFLARFSSL